MPLHKLFISLLFICTFSIAILSQSFSESHSKIRKSVENRDFSSALSELKLIQKDNQNIFEANNYDYLLARLSENKGDFATAIANYQTVVNRNSILKEYALWHLSQIMRSTGNLLMERLYLQELSIIAEKSLLKNAIKKRFTKSYMESGNYSEVINLLSGESSIISNQESKSIVENVKDNLQNFLEDISREDLVLLGYAYLQNGNANKAKEVFNELVNNLPKENQPDDFALAGARGLDNLGVPENKLGKNIPKLTAEEHFKRATIYQFNRNFSLARLHYEAIVKNHPSNSKVQVSLYQIARGFGQERNYEKAVEWSEKLQKDYPKDKLASAALYQTAGAYANLNKTNESVSRYIKYIDENPDARNLERAYLNIIDAYRDAGKIKAALNWTSKTQERFKGEMGEAVALFSQIRIHISQENWQNAISDLNRLKGMKNLGGVRIAGGTNKDEVTFLHGFVLEKLERFDEAVEVYLSIENGFDNYYGWRAEERATKLKQDGKASKNIKRKPTDNVLPPFKPLRISEFGRKNVLKAPQKERSHKTIADELLFLGLFDEATPELETAFREDTSQNTGSLSDFSSEIALTLADYYRRGDMAHRAISYIEPSYKKGFKQLPPNLIPRQYLKLFFPKPYQDSLVKYGKEYKVDPRFLLSIMRQESRFQANVKSVAAARGLMQFISNTSNVMAKEMKIENFQQDDLYNPPTAIRFGSHYINKIFKDFPNQPPAVAASYNGGEDRMMRWYKRANTDNPDRYVPEVIFSQTKDYVYKVMTNYRIYKMLYDENLNDINK